VNDKSFANGNSNSQGAGPDVLPLWLRHDWQTAMARQAQPHQLAQP
jgi:hypothetical protein